MSIANTTGERIFDAFVESPSRANKTAVEVTGQLDSVNGPLSGILWDNFTYQYPSPTQEIVSLFEGVTLKATVTLNYTDATKKYLSSGSVVTP
jgi:hypothetical protein